MLQSLKIENYPIRAGKLTQTSFSISLRKKTIEVQDIEPNGRVNSSTHV